ncbi:helix-turn-helix transcriptional regulator [Streptomyces sp. P1-3]|uniref:helix-turn-helix transcriptional regulator n=1 Tax=Streptomyces sp. P1-3 TaxID=3421658 RepID=UPI003D36CAB1
MDPMDELAGRHRERAALEDFLTGVRSGAGRVLAVRGEPGVGKSALLRHAVAGAAPARVLRATGAEPEAGLAFAALHQLLRPVAALGDALPAAQRDAVRAALGLTAPAAAQDRFLVSAGVLSLLAEAARPHGLVCVVDDFHWVDRASADALLFAARRLDTDAVGLLIATRDTADARHALRGLPGLRLAGLDAAEAALALAAWTAVEPAPQVADRLAAATGGNPLAMLETAELLTAGQLTGREPLPDPLPLGDGVNAVYGEQIARLPDDTRRTLLVAALDGPGDPGVVLGAASRLGAPPEAVHAAEAAGLVEVTPDAIGFRHPLVRSAVHAAASPADRRAAHTALAAVLDERGDADRRARHRAAAALGPDEDIAADLAAAADRARTRGGYADAADALTRAARLTPDPRTRARRLTDAAVTAWLGGRPGQAQTAVAAAAEATQDPAVCIELAQLRGRFELNAGDAAEALRIFLAAADGAAADGAAADGGAPAGSPPDGALGGLMAAGSPGGDGEVTGLPAPGEAAAYPAELNGGGGGPGAVPAPATVGADGSAPALGAEPGDAAARPVAAGRPAAGRGRIGLGGTASGVAAARDSAADGTGTGADPDRADPVDRADAVAHAAAPGEALAGGGQGADLRAAEAHIAAAPADLVDADPAGADPAGAASAARIRQATAPAADLRQTVSLLADAAEAAAYVGDTDAAVRIGRRAEVLRGPWDHATAFLRDVLVGAGALQGGDARRGVPLLRRALAGVRSDEDDAATLLWAANAASLLGEGDAAADYGARAGGVARVSGMTGTLPVVLENAATAERMNSRFALSAALSTEGLALARASGTTNSAAAHLANLAVCAAVSGREDECRDHAHQALAIAIPHRLGLRAGVASYALGVLDLGMGRFQQAHERFTALTAAGPGAGHPVVVWGSVADRTEAAVAAGDRAAARDAVDFLGRWSAHAASPRSRALLARCRALAATDDDAAVTLLRDALGLLAADSGAGYDRARTALLLGERLRRDRRAAEARPHLRQAAESFRRMGAEPWERRALGELRAAGETADRPAPDTLAALTAQELRIARLVADGASNKEVAARLFLSPRTVEYHLYKVYPKLGITSRTELARLVQRTAP